MAAVSFSFDDIIKSVATWIFNHVDNITDYSKNHEEWIGGTVNIIRAPYTALHQDITPSKEKGNHQRSKGKDNSGPAPAATWTLVSNTIPSDQHTLTIANIEQHIKNFINVSQGLKLPFADDLIQLFNHISQFCIESLKFHRQVFDQSNPPNGATSGFLKIPKTYLSYTPPISKHATPNYNFSDIVIAKTADDTINNLISAVSKHIPSVVIQYTIQITH